MDLLIAKDGKYHAVHVTNCEVKSTGDNGHMVILETDTTDVTVELSFDMGSTGLFSSEKPSWRETLAHVLKLTLHELMSINERQGTPWTLTELLYRCKAECKANILMTLTRTTFTVGCSKNTNLDCPCGNGDFVTEKELEYANRIHELEARLKNAEKDATIKVLDKVLEVAEGLEKNHSKVERVSKLHRLSKLIEKWSRHIQKSEDVKSASDMEYIDTWTNNWADVDLPSNPASQVMLTESQSVTEGSVALNEKMYNKLDKPPAAVVVHYPILSADTVVFGKVIVDHNPDAPDVQLHPLDITKLCCDFGSAIASVIPLTIAQYESTPPGKSD